MPSRKPHIQGFGCRLGVGGDTLSCEALFVGTEVPDQALDAQLHERHKHPKRVLLDWTSVTPGLYQNARIDIVREE